MEGDIDPGGRRNDQQYGLLRDTTMLGTLLLMSTWMALDSDVTPHAPELEVQSITQVTTAGENLKPFVVAKPRGGVYLAWARRTDDRTAVLFASSDDGEHFSAPVQVSRDGMDLDLGAESAPNVAVDSSGAIYVVWASGVWSEANRPARAQDKPATSPKDRTASSASHGHSGHSDRGAPARPNNLNIYLSRSTDQGRTFSAPTKLNDDADGPEHRFPTVSVDDRGTVFVAWLDKRPRSDGSGACRVFVTRSTDRDQTFSSNIDATAGQENSICHCCRIGIAARADGKLSVAFRNEIDDVRDIFLTSLDERVRFTDPEPVEHTEWYVPRCPMNGPALAWDDSTNLHAIWVTGADLSQRPLVQSGISNGYKILYRQMGGASSAGPRYIADGEHAHLAAAQHGIVHVAWECRGIVSVGSMNENPTVMHPIPLSASGSHPSLALAANRADAVIAWQERLADESVQIKVALLQVRSESGQ
jgi:hypothetical protein